MLHVSRYHSGSVKVRAVWRFNFSNFHTAFRNKTDVGTLSRVYLSPQSRKVCKSCAHSARFSSNVARLLVG